MLGGDRMESLLLPLVIPAPRPSATRTRRLFAVSGAAHKNAPGGQVTSSLPLRSDSCLSGTQTGAESLTRDQRSWLDAPRQPRGLGRSGVSPVRTGLNWNIFKDGRLPPMSKNRFTWRSGTGSGWARPEAQSQAGGAQRVPEARRLFAGCSGSLEGLRLVVGASWVSSPGRLRGRSRRPCLLHPWR